MRNRQQRGSALTMAMIAMFFVMMVGLGLSALTLQTVKLTRRDSQEAVAFNLAESGAERGVRYLKDLGTGIYSLTSARDPFGGAVTTTGGTYQVTITPYGDTASALRMYRVLSTGVSANGTEQVEVIVRQQSFGMYAYFTDRETSSLSNGSIWFASSDRIRGPAHSNNQGSTEFQVNWGSATSPIFEDMLTSVESTITYSPSRPTTESQFQRIYSGGSRGYQLNLDPIPLPATTDSQRNAAWGGSTGFPTTTTGVSVRTNGGIYIRGDCAIQMSQLTGNIQQFRITQGSTVTTVTVNPQTGIMTRQVGTGSVTTIAGSTGVVYCTGNITSLNGTIADNITTGSGSGTAIVARNSYTIATDVANGKGITIDNTLRHNTQLDFSASFTSGSNLLTGTLGLIGRNIMVKSGAPTNMQIDAVMLAGSSSFTDGSFYVQDYDSKTPTGTLRITGGIIQKARGPVGTISGSTIQTGYAKNYMYDPRLGAFPPPHFPITPNYDRISWRRL